MLALSRRKDEGIIIDGNITIKVLDISEGKVRLGIEAPKDINIYREEVYIEIEQSNGEAIPTQKVNLQGLSKLIQKK